MAFRDWPDRLRCPVCRQLTGSLLDAVTAASGKPHFECSRCHYTWIPNAKARDARRRAERARRLGKLALLRARRVFRKARKSLKPE
jgi:hypothetical protein